MGKREFGKMSTHSKDIQIILALCALAILLFIFVAPNLAIHVDEYPYIRAGHQYSGWIANLSKGLLTGNMTKVKTVLSNRDAAWEFNHEHPPVAKIVFGLSGRAFDGALGLRVASRIGGLFFTLLLVICLYLLVAPKYGRLAGALGAAAVLSHPRILAHGFTCGMDLPVAALSLLCALFFIGGLEKRSHAILCGITLGLTVGTKVNGLFLIVPLLLWGYLFHRKKMGENLFWMIVAGPAAFLLTWPWLWHNTFARVIAYLQFHAQHKIEPVFYLGTALEAAPWHYPLVTLIAATPLIILLLALPSLKTRWGKPIDSHFTFLVMLAAVPILVITPQSVPAYNDLRLFLLTPVILCGLAGIGVSIIFEMLKGLLPENKHRFLAAGLVLLLLLPGIIGLAVTHPYPLSYYGGAVGYRSGAMEKGFSPLPWAQIAPSDIEKIEEKFPQGIDISRNSGVATILVDANTLGFLSKKIRLPEKGGNWLISSNFSYSGFPQYWTLWYDVDPSFHRVMDFKHDGIRFQALYAPAKAPTKKPPKPLAKPGPGPIYLQK